MIGRTIRLLQPHGRYKKGARGVIVGALGDCGIFMRWVVRMEADGGEIELAMQSLGGKYRRWKFGR